MKYREMRHYTKGGVEVVGAVTLEDGVIGFESIPQLRIDTWQEDGIRLGSRTFKPDTTPVPFFNWLQLSNSSYIKFGPVYERVGGE